jgi:hypothetical protein
MTRRKDRYQPRAASASQPKTLKGSVAAIAREVADVLTHLRQCDLLNS